LTQAGRSKVIGGKLVVAPPPTALLDPVEEALDPVAVAVEIRAEAKRRSLLDLEPASSPQNVDSGGHSRRN
jgi:hypothetical protein